MTDDQRFGTIVFSLIRSGVIFATIIAHLAGDESKATLIFSGISIGMLIWQFIVFCSVLNIAWEKS